LRFARLRLSGFKSFVDPTDLVIQDGLTGVVGPNGCGKSNLLEALRWVMGENRPSVMRGDGMEDVIFAGAATRPARNFAEVALNIDNTARTAPGAFNTEDHIDITRRITRDAGSAFKLNGKDVRARDVQMLFADASTGAQSPALVRQGQITELINARPKARRRILEDAAGIAGLFQRRHEAELKLRNAETNLERLDDVIGALAARMASLEKQARQAARYRDLASHLRQAEGLLLFLRWRDADLARADADAALTGFLQDTARAEAAARKAHAAREAAEAALPPLREEDAIAAAVVQRHVIERDGIEAEAERAESQIAALTVQLDRIAGDLDRETTLNADADASMVRLRQEQAALEGEDGGEEAEIAAKTAEVEAATEVLGQAEADLTGLTQRRADARARHEAIATALRGAEADLERHRAAAEAARSAGQAARDKLDTVRADTRAAGDALSAAEDAVAEAEARIADTETTRADTETETATARAAVSTAEGRVKALVSERDAVAAMLREAGDGADRVLDSIRVEPGYEAALGAALGDDLEWGSVAGADASGWHPLSGPDTPEPLPEGAEPIADVTRAPAALARRMARIGVVSEDLGQALQGQLRPGQRLVSRAGDLWRWDGFTCRAGDQASGAARRLEQKNRLDALAQELERAEAELAGAQDVLTQAVARRDAVIEADRAARADRKDAEAAVARARRKQAELEAEELRLAGTVETQAQALERYEAEAEAAEKAVADIRADQGGLADLSEIDAEVATAQARVDEARRVLLDARAARDAVAERAARRTERLSAIIRELATWTERAGTAATRLTDLEARKAETETALAEARRGPADIETRRAKLADIMQAAEARRRASADALAEGETVLRDAILAEREAERDASAAREARAAGEARAGAARDAVEQAAGRILEDQHQTPEALRDALGDLPDPLPRLAEIEADVTRLRRQRDSLGAVNLRAEEDAREVAEEHDSLTVEKADLEAAIAKLRSGIAALNKEGRERLLAAFEEVNANFGQLFTLLFGGGEARLVMVESDDPLDAGLEILCQPPGKKLSTMSLLSGGEQTLTALAMIFAVFLANPAPICVLDEVDAPLDDANVTRLCDLLDEMTRRTETRFLIITHHAVTMARMDRLFGVTMAEQGVSQLVSVDLNKAEQLVA
jgi:chromosome segregation protein